MKIHEQWPSIGGNSRRSSSTTQFAIDVDVVIYLKQNGKAETVAHLTITKTCHAINIYHFSSKTENFQLKNFDIFLISAQNKDSGHTLDPPWPEYVNHLHF